MEEDKRMGRKKFQFGLTKNARTGTKKPQTSCWISLLNTQICLFTLFLTFMYRFLEFSRSPAELSNR